MDLILIVNNSCISSHKRLIVLCHNLTLILIGVFSLLIFNDDGLLLIFHFLLDFL
jgi:hypothetical protein